MKTMVNFIYQGKVISKDNEKIFNIRGRPFVSKKYRDFEDDVIRQFESQIQCHPFIVPVRVDVVFCFKNKVHSDLTNCTKSFFDALNRKLWHDDRLIKSCCLSIEYGDFEGAKLSCSELTETI